jgi:hypothetical protein
MHEGIAVSIPAHGLASRRSISECSRFPLIIYLHLLLKKVSHSLPEIILPGHTLSAFYERLYFDFDDIIALIL